MAKLTTSFTKNKKKHFDSTMLQIGELMECIEDGLYCNHIMLRTYNSIVSLTDPKSTWGSRVHLLGRKLLPGESVTLTQE